MSSDPLCLLGGEIVPLSEARLSPLDRGFLFGDAVYEAMKVVNGRLLFLEPHLARLTKSLAAMRIPEPPGIADSLRRLVDAAQLAHGSLYMQVSRGAAPARSHLPPPGLAPTLFALPTPIDFPAEPWALPGLAAISKPDDRWRHCDVKTTALAAIVLGKLEAADQGAVESLFVGPSGELREGGNTNLFVRDNAGWHTHPTSDAILAGITRSILLAESSRLGLPVAERAPRLGAREGWREAFLCGTLTGVRGLTRLDGAAIGNGEVGDETRRFARLLSEVEQAAAQEL